MKPHRWALASAALLAALALAPGRARADGLDVEVWTDRGSDAVYDLGDVMEVRARSSDDAYLLVYELDAEGYVRLLFPYRGSNGFVAGRETHDVPDPRSNLELVVQEPVGQAFIVAIASYEPFGELPWYLRPYDAQAEGVGYAGEEDEEEGITAEGRIVGDPFVAMERIRRRILASPDDPDAFGTAYTSYYVHQEVKYPRYLCYDCHRPGRWAWWADFDPYYTTCNVFEFRVNYGWCWGPRYWFGSVPYYWYVPRHDCGPRYRVAARYSPWDGWRRWNTLWGSSLSRYKTPPPIGYVGPPKYRDRGRWRSGDQPPGFVAADARRGAAGIGGRLPIGRRTRPGGSDEDRGRRSHDPRGVTDGRDRGGRGPEPMPAHDPARDRDRVWRGDDRGRAPEGRDDRVRRAPRFERGGAGVERRDEGSRAPSGRAEEPRPRFERGDGTRRSFERGVPRLERPGIDEGRRGRSIDREVSPGVERSAPRIERPRMERRATRMDRPAAPPRERGGFERVLRGPERSAAPRQERGVIERVVRGPERSEAPRQERRVERGGRGSESRAPGQRADRGSDRGDRGRRDR